MWQVTVILECETLAAVTAYIIETTAQFANIQSLQALALAAGAACNPAVID